MRTKSMIIGAIIADLLAICVFFISQSIGVLIPGLLAINMLFPGYCIPIAPAPCAPLLTPTQTQFYVMAVIGVSTVVVLYSAIGAILGHFIGKYLLPSGK
jgi:hypothetical protein